MLAGRGRWWTRLTLQRASPGGHVATPWMTLDQSLASVWPVM